MSLSNASIVRLANSQQFQAFHQAKLTKTILQRAIEIQQIPAPTFDEKARAEHVKAFFQKIGLQNVIQDDLFNVYGWLYSDQPKAPTLLISAHTDTVFPHETDLSIRQETNRIYGPGIGDNSLGVAGLLTLAELFSQYDLPRAANICFVANTQEEGLGDLGGIKDALDYLENQIAAGIIIEGMALGRIYHSGIAVKRLKVTVNAPGGHSWLHFGTPSAVHALVKFCASLIDIPVSEDPRTTYNIGLIEGGSSINTIAASASCFLDLRSANAATLATLEESIRDIAARYATEDVQFHFETVGDRPAGAIPDNHPLVKLAIGSHNAIKMNVECESGSTDTNALLARNIPAICVGISYGGGAHTIGEYIEITPIQDGFWQLLLLATATANAVAAW